MDINIHKDNKSFIIKEVIKSHDDSIHVKNDTDQKYICGLVAHLLYQSNAFNENSKFLKSTMKTSNLSDIDRNTDYNENFIKQMRFIPNNKELVLINNKNQIIINSIDMDSIVSNSNEKSIRDNNYCYKESEVETSKMIFEENNHIYEVEM